MRRAGPVLSLRMDKTGKVALLWRGDREARRTATAQTTRLSRIFEALAAAGITAEPCVFSEEFADEVREQLLTCAGVLVWVDPWSDGKTRKVLDPLLRDVAAKGVWVSAHPDVILKMGVKEVLHRTRALGWGTDTHLYRTAAAIPRGVPGQASRIGPTGVEAQPRQWRARRVEGGNAARRIWCACSMRSAAACRRNFRSAPSWRAANPISQKAAASSTSRSSRGCRTE